MAQYKLVSSFDIDDGQLDGLTMQESFILGYELAQIDSLLSASEAFQKPVHVENRERIEKRCAASGREYGLNYMQDDASESWLWLRVAEADL